MPGGRGATGFLVKPRRGPTRGLIIAQQTSWCHAAERARHAGDDGEPAVAVPADVLLLEPLRHAPRDAQRLAPPQVRCAQCTMCHTLRNDAAPGNATAADDDGAGVVVAAAACFLSQDGPKGADKSRLQSMGWLHSQDETIQYRVALREEGD